MDNGKAVTFIGICIVRVPYSFSDIEWIDRNYSKVKCPLGLKDLPLGK